jgi:hypothetical protein
MALLKFIVSRYCHPKMHTCRLEYSIILVLRLIVLWKISAKPAHYKISLSLKSETLPEPFQESHGVLHAYAEVALKQAGRQNIGVTISVNMPGLRLPEPVAMARVKVTAQVSLL